MDSPKTLEEAIAEQYAKESGFELQNNDQEVTNEDAAEETNVQKEVIQEQPATPAEPAAPSPNDEMLKQLEEYKAKLQEYEAKLQEQPAQREPEFANEHIKKLNELAKAGVDVESDDFWKWQAIDVAAMSPDERSSAIELVRLELKAKNPDLSADRIERKIRRKYEALFDEGLTEEDREYRVALEELMDDAFDAKKTVLEFKNKVTLPKVDVEAKRRQEEEVQKAIQQFNLSVKQAVSSYSEESIKITPELELKYAPSEDSKKFIESSLVNSRTLLEDLWVDKTTGTVNLKKAQRDLLLISEFDKIAKVIYDQGISVGREEIATQIENSDRVVTPVGGVEPPADLYVEALRKALVQF